MNSNASKTVINLKEVVWDLLTQWKAVLVTAILMAVLVSGLKYVKDTKTYNAANDEAAASLEAALTIDQKIAAVLDALPEDERTTVEYLSKQEDWIRSEKEYISDSILLNSNPANQRTLTLSYLISVSDASESRIASLQAGYAGSLNSKQMTDKLKQVINPDADKRYITELIKINADNSAINEGKIRFINSDESAAVLSIYVVLPEEADAKAVEEAVTTGLKEESDGLKSKIGRHSISLLQSEECYLFNADAVEEYNNVLYSINTLTNNSKNMKTSLSDAQKAALESIAAIKTETQNADEAAGTESAEAATAAPKPGFSKKYAILGFVLGAFVYAFVYLMIIIMRGRINSAMDMEYYTQRRVLGEIYGKDKAKGLSWLMSSRFVEKNRYKARDDVEAQTGKAVESVYAVCEHGSIKSMTFLNMSSCEDKNFKNIREEVQKKGIKAAVTEIAENFDEKNLLDIDNAIVVAGPDTKAAKLIGLLTLCDDYDIKVLGSIYIDPHAMSVGKE